MRLLHVLAAALLLTGMTACVDFDAPPDYTTVVAPVSTTAFYGETQLTTGVATAVVFVVHNASGSHGATEVHSLDETIMKIEPTTLEREILSESSNQHATGKVFLVYGIAQGSANAEVFLDGEDQGAVEIDVLDQN